MGKITHLTRDEFETPEGRKAAWKSLMLEDHGVLRKIYDNSHQISDEMWRSYQPSPAKIREWREKHGVQTIINLRGIREEGPQPAFYWLEEEACRENGIKLVNFRAFSREAPHKEFIAGIDDLFRTMAYPAMMHCKSGADRAGISSVLYKFLREGTSLADAREQLTFKYGHVKAGKTGVLGFFFDVYEAAAKVDCVEPNREHFLAWAASDAYDPKAVTAAFKAGKMGSFITDTVLRRE